MLPDVSFMLRQWFGIDFPLPFKTFGLFLALSIFTAAYVLYLELKRKEKTGELPLVKMTHKVGMPPSIPDIFLYTLLGFLLGFKGLFALTNYKMCVGDPQGFLTSGQGNVLAGIIGGIALGAYRYFTVKRKQKETPETITEMVKPHLLAGDITIVAAISGVLGAKFFDAIENMHDLLANPIGTLVSFSGLAFYGGLIFGTVAVVVYLILKKLPILHFADAIAPTLIIGYAVGRIGCQLAGDGDWGIVNLNPKPFAWIPDWAWAYRYPHNVVETGDSLNILIPNYQGPYPYQLMHPVYPTPIYESLLGFVIFGILWALRKRLKIPGLLFCLYLILNGIERFFIEFIRVNKHYNFLGLSLTQAQEIALYLFAGGVVGIPVIIYFFRSQPSNPYLFTGKGGPENSADHAIQDKPEVGKETNSDIPPAL